MTSVIIDYDVNHENTYQQTLRFKPLKVTPSHLIVSISLKKMRTFLALLALGFFDLGIATTTPTPTTTTTTTTTTTATTTTTDDSGNTNRPFMLCSYAKNDIGTCECPGQFFIAEECHKVRLFLTTINNNCASIHIFRDSSA